MVRLPLVTAIAAFAALPAAAQYIDQGYRDAHAIFGNVGANNEFAIANMEKLIPALQGRWIPVDILAGGGPSPDANSPLIDFEQYCGRIGFDLTATSRFSFQMLQNDLANPESPTVAYRFDYTGYNSFIRSRDTDEFLTRLGFADDALVPPAVLGENLSRAIVLLYHPNRDSLVLVNISGRTEYYGRCP